MTTTDTLSSNDINSRSNLVVLPTKELIHENCIHFVDDILHLFSDQSSSSLVTDKLIRLRHYVKHIISSHDLYHLILEHIDRPDVKRCIQMRNHRCLFNMNFFFDNSDDVKRSCGDYNFLIEWMWSEVKSHNRLIIWKWIDKIVDDVLLLHSNDQ